MINITVYIRKRFRAETVYQPISPSDIIVAVKVINFTFNIYSRLITIVSKNIAFIILFIIIIVIYIFTILYHSKLNM